MDVDTNEIDQDKKSQSHPAANNQNFNVRSLSDIPDSENNSLISPSELEMNLLTETMKLDVKTLSQHSKGVYSVAFNQATPSLLASAYLLFF